MATTTDMLLKLMIPGQTLEKYTEKENKKSNSIADIIELHGYTAIN